MRAKSKGLIGGLLLLAACACSHNGRNQEARTPDVSVTVYPVVLGTQTSPEVTQFVAILLERGGLDTIELAPDAFTDGTEASFDRQAQDFAAFVAKQGTKTDRALFAAYLGSPARGVDEVRAVLVDADGKVIWKDRQRPGDAAFDRVKPRNPMACTQLLMGQLREPLHLKDPFRKDAPEGKLAKRFEREAGIPDDAERAAMDKRLQQLRQAAPKATVAVYPVRVDKQYVEADAEALAVRIDAEKLLAAKAVPGEIRFEFTPSMNEQKVLWSAARSIQKAARQQPAEKDYRLFAHYMLAPNGKQAFAVHLFVLDRNGDLVLVDYQNSHHKDFRRIDPKSADDCTKLAVARLAHYLK